VREIGNHFTLALRKPVTAASALEAARSPEAHRAIRARRQAIRRRLRLRISKSERERLTGELEWLAWAETGFFAVKHRETTLPLGKDGKQYVPKTARGRLHVPLSALPLNLRGRKHVPSAKEIVVAAVFEKFLNKGNLPMALAKAAAIYPEKYRAEALEFAKQSRALRRALNRVGHDVSKGWPLKRDELVVLENFYATTMFWRPLKGMAPDLAVKMITETTVDLMVDRYRRILRKFFLA
jgi:hypothetical protein